MSPAAALTLDRLRADGESFMRDISREYYLAYSGHKSNADLQPVYARYAQVLGEDAQAVSLDALRDAEPGSDEHRSALLLVDWLADAQSSRQLAALDERQIAWEGSAIVDVDGRRRTAVRGRGDRDRQHD